ncbi:hypothetical protein NW754_007611 [Fusarium falciforme]|nr:hypothetical protein NW754_007611 [Fusarium falciforme]
MTKADNTTTPMHDLKNTPPDPSLGGETERDTEDHPEPSPDGPADGPPDGGAAAWLVVLGAWCCSFSSPGWINSVGSFQQYYEVGPLKGYSSSTIAWIPSLQIFFLFALGPIVGILFDKYGPRPLIVGGTLLHVFGLMMASLAKTYYQFILSQGPPNHCDHHGPSESEARAQKIPAGRYAAPFTEIPFIMLLLGIFVLTYGIFIPIDYLAVQAFQEAHVSDEMAQYLVSIFNAASLFGRLAAGYGADIIGRWNMFIIACALSGISEFAVWIPAKHSSIAIGFAIMFGFASGAFIGLSGALPISVSPPAEIGYRLGVLLLAISIPALTMAPIGGAILQNSTNGWLGVKIFGGVMCLAGSAITFVSRLLYTDKKLLKVF